MNQDESIALFKRCEAARAEAREAGKDERAAHEAAKAVWNAWAGEMLAKRKALEDAGEWALEDWTGDLEPQNDATREWMEAAAVDFSRVRFTVALAQTDKPAGKGLESDNAAGAIIKSIAVESNAIRFDGIIFPGTAWLRGATFAGAARFGEATFTGNAWFDEATFTGSARFAGATFAGEAEFARATFAGAALFKRATFTGDAEFQGATFAYNAWFEEATFSGEAWFAQATFAGTAWFGKATFMGNAGFEGATFTGQAHFAWAKFARRARFARATFKGSARFGKATFTGTALFAEATFNGDAWFEKATFSGDARFEKAAFTGDALFGKATFTGTAGFESAQFATNAFFDDAKFCGDADFFLAKFEHLASFANARFGGRADFGAIRGERSFSLAEAEFDGVPDFIQAHFEEAPRLDNIRIHARMIDPPATFLEEITQTPLSWSIRFRVGAWRRVTAADRTIPARFRALKRLAIHGHDSDREHEFFGREIRHARFAGDWPLPWPFWKLEGWAGAARFWWGLAYQVFGGLGTSLIRPLMWWLLTIGIATTLYLGENQEMIRERQILQQRDGASPLSAYAQSTADAAWYAPRACYAPSPPADVNVTHVGALSASVRAGTDAPTEALHLAFRNAFIVLDGGADAAHRTYGCLYGVELFGGSNPVTVVPNWVSAVSAAQKLVSALFIFLFGLAVRNMLKMK